MAETNVNHNKKVCIVVPVYNAAKFLGHCLNSILSQTHTNWTAILVDDGSTDNSAEICQRYVNLDSRFRLVSKPNGGVSSARNAGLDLAEGDYLEFLDSDDCLAPNALERQISLAEQYNTPLVMMDIRMVDFSNPSENQTLLSSAWLQESPCQLTAEEFKAKKMRLVWFTVLLECLHAKLYDLSLWQKLNLRFPEDLSLGEDFVTNMKYFDACDNVVFVRECGHYYNCITASSSLTNKYRADLFEVKMYLNEAVEAHLGGREHLSDEEKDAFYCYVASNGLTCVEKMVLDSGYDHDAMIRRAEEMLNHPLFHESLCRAGYVPDRFNSYIDFFRNKDCEKVILGIRGRLNRAEAPTPAPEAPAETEVTAEPVFTPAPAKAAAPVYVAPPHKPGFLNRAIRKIMRAMASRTRDDLWKRRLSRWENEIKVNGLKLALRNLRNSRKKLNRNDLALLQEENSRLLRLLQAQEDRLYVTVAQQNNLIAAQADRIHGEVNSRVCGVYNQVQAQFEALNQQLNGQFDALSRTAETGMQKQEAFVYSQTNRLVQLLTQDITKREAALHNELNRLNQDMLARETALRAEMDRLAQMFNQDMTKRESTLRAEMDRLAQMFNQDMAKQESALRVEMDRLARMLDEKAAVTANSITAASEYVRKEVTDHTWLVEQRLHNYTYQRDINDLRQKKKAIMIATAEHVNIGDAAITLAEQQFLRQHFADYYQVEISTYEFSRKETYLHAILNPEDIIFINGGGNMGDVYPEEEALHRAIVEAFPSNKIVIFPQTIYFTVTEAGARELALSANVYNRHPDLTLYVRGEESLTFAKRHFPQVSAFLMPDMVHLLKTDYRFDREGALLCLRDDDEGVLSEEQKQKIAFDVLSQVGSVDYSTNVHCADIGRDIRAQVVHEELMRFARHKVALTDRLHGMIFAAVTGTPCVVFGSFNQKIREYYNTFFADCDGIVFVDGQMEAVYDAVKQVLAIEDIRCPILEQNPHAGIRSALLDK